MRLDRLRLRLPPLALTLLLAPLTGGLGRWLPTANLPFPGQRPLALVLVALGMLFLFGSAWQFRRAGTTLDPRVPDQTTRMVSGGFFRLSRNPMYLGMALALLGLATWFASLPGVAVVAGFVVYMNSMQIAPEEQALSARFGEDYLRYTRRVRRWI